MAGLRNYLEMGVHSAVLRLVKRLGDAYGLVDVHIDLLLGYPPVPVLEHLQRGFAITIDRRLIDNP